MCLKLDGHGYSPRVLHQILYAAGQCKSFALAGTMLATLGDIAVSTPHLAELAAEIGQELTTTRDRQVSELPPATTRDQCPGEAPVAVAVEVDGGRIRTRAEGHGRGVHDPHWNEDKAACLVTVTSRTFDADPHPALPGCFLDRPRVQRLVREISGQRTGDPSSAGEDELALPACAAEVGPGPPSGPTVAAGTDDPPPASAAVPTGPARPDWKPKRDLRTCVATMAESDLFGKQVASEAYRRNFYRANRRAFVADGQKYNWAIHDRHFADFVGITDVVHVLSYVYAAGLAVAGSAAAGWPLYARWVRACWQGRVDEVRAELEQWQQGQPTPPSKPPPTDPWEVVRKTVTYLTNNAGRMNYPSYRQAGLPCMSSWMESLVKEINYRVKGSEKFWNRGPNAEAILQVRAAVLSEDDRLWEHIRNRGGNAFRTYRRKATEAK
ncbi:MAG: LysR family transcriptional regulator [Gemmataceae bacterium]|nr:LysR family transcriptional regulator [Gemmataceae bacterium]